MDDKFDRHTGEDDLEKYAMGALSARMAGEIEEHLLICEQCRQALVESEAYLAAMREAAGKARQAQEEPVQQPSDKANGNP